MDTTHGHVVCDEVALAEEVVMLDYWATTEIHFHDGQDLPPAFCPRPGRSGMVDHLSGHEFVDRTVVTVGQATKQLLDYRLGVTRFHRHSA